MPPINSIDQKKLHTQRTVLLATDNKNSVLVEVVGNDTNHRAYSAYGHQSAQENVASQLGFNGELHEAKTGWYLLGNGYRAYNPRLMRFHSPDSWSPFGRGELNPYMYCAGDPINRSDPTGHVTLFNKVIDFAFSVKRFFSGDPGFNVSGGGNGLARGAQGLLVNIANNRPVRPPPVDSRITSVYQDVGSAPRPALTGPGVLFAGFADAGGFRNSGSGSSRTSYSTQRITRSNSLPPSYDPPPSYNEAMALSNADTFSSSQRGRSYVVNRVSDPNSRYGTFYPPRMQHRQLPPVPPPPPLPRPRIPSPTPPSSRDSTPPRSRNPSGDPPLAGRDQNPTYAAMALIRGG